MKTYFKTDYITIGYSENGRFLLMTWLVSPTSGEFRVGMNAVITAIIHFKTGKMVSDSTRLGALHPDDQKWVATEWFEEAVRNGYSHVAAVLPPAIFTRLSVEDAYSHVANPIPFANFEDMEDAIEWIRKF